MIVICSNCARKIEFNRKTIPWNVKIVNGYKLKEKWINCECGRKCCVEVQIRG